MWSRPESECRAPRKPLRCDRVLRTRYPEMPPSAYMLTGAAEKAGFSAPVGAVETWVQDEQAEALQAAISADLQRQFPGTQVQAQRTDYASNGDPFATVRLAVAGVAGVVLLLGAVGMLNISMVTVRYRGREIGIRRGPGQCSGRILGVMMETWWRRRWPGRRASCSLSLWSSTQGSSPREPRVPPRFRCFSGRSRDVGTRDGGTGGRFGRCASSALVVCGLRPEELIRLEVHARGRRAARNRGSEVGAGVNRGECRRWRGSMKLDVAARARAL